MLYILISLLLSMPILAIADAPKPNPATNKARETIIKVDENKLDGLDYRKKCKTYRSLIVKQLLNVCGNVTVGGNVTIGGGLTVGGIPFGSLLAYGYASSQTIQTVNTNNDVVFTSFAPSSANVTNNNTTTITVPAGTYAFSFYFEGLAGANTAIGFELFNQSLATPAAVPNSQFTSGAVAAAAAATSLTVNGSGLAHFTQPTTLSLRNVLGNATNQPNGAPITQVYASMSLIRIAA